MWNTSNFAHWVFRQPEWIRASGGAALDDLSAQEEVLALEYPAGREPITERTLRRLLESLVWEDQRALWAELRAVAG